MNQNLSVTKRTSGGAGIAVLGVVGVLVVLAVIIAMWAVGINNKIVKLNQGADTAWAQVQSQYQRRLDLIPNLVATVKGAAQQEVQVVVGAIEARAKATQVNINPSDPAQFEQFAQSQSALGGALSRLLVTVEKYPEIRTNQNFLELQSQIEGTENRISVERMNFNQAVQAYNNAVLTFPGSFVAGFRNFQKRPFFTGTVEAQTAPKVDFGAPATLATPPPAPVVAPAPTAAAAPAVDKTAAPTPVASPTPTPAL